MVEKGGQRQSGISGAGLISAGGGRHVWFLGNRMTIKHGLGPDDGMSLIDGELQPGHAPPVHVHQHEDELFYVLSGSVHFRCGDEEFDAGSGDSVYVPRGTRHAFKVGANGARTIMISTSPLLARFMAAGGRSAHDEDPTSFSQSELKRVSELASFYDMDVVGPPIG
jgi:quercetin dioxygenase-like cupin family protein